MLLRKRDYLPFGVAYSIQQPFRSHLINMSVISKRSLIFLSQIISKYNKNKYWTALYTLL